jgi:uncharacterized protein YkwD
VSNFGPTPNPDIRTALVTGLYASILGRTPEPAGLAAGVAALQAGASVEQIAVGLFGSAEYRQLAQATVVGDSQAMLAAINQARAANTPPLPPMIANPLLQAMAQSHADAMAKSGIEDHDLAGDGTFVQRVKDSGYNGSLEEEIIDTADNVPHAFAMWMSEGPGGPHHDAILGPCTEAGCGKATAADGTGYYCVDTGRPA